MAGKDKHPSLSPTRFSTNKRLKVGEKNGGLGAKFVPATVTPKAERKAAVMATAVENANRRDKLRAKVAAELKAKRGVLGFEGASRLGYMKSRFPGGGMT